MYFKKALSFDDVLLEPQYSTCGSRNDIDISTTISGIKLKIPIISANMSSVTGKDMVSEMMRLGGMAIIPRTIPLEEVIGILEPYRNIDRVPDSGAIGVSFGVQDNWKEQVEVGIKYGADILCLDVAHADNIKVLNVVSRYMEMQETFNFPVIFGNIATERAYKNIISIVINVLKQKGLTLEKIDVYIKNNISFKVGIGGGSLCTTRIMTGCGIPTLHSVMDIFSGNCFNCGIIADGGIKSSGDIVKSLAAGANAVMLGSLLAGTKEAPGNVIKGNNGSLYKVYRGSASFADKKDRNERVAFIEGTEALVPYKGAVENIINGLCDGLRSGMSYCGAMNIAELRENARFVEITHAGLRESHPHGLLT
jgi:IMP dehydrogenase